MIGRTKKRVEMKPKGVILYKIQLKVVIKLDNKENECAKKS